MDVILLEDLTGVGSKGAVVHVKPGYARNFLLPRRLAIPAGDKAANLYQELQRPESTRLASIAVLFHSRLTRPILGIILVFLGLSTILRDQNRNVFISAGLCLLMCGVFFAAQFACKGLGDYEYLSPALAAWQEAWSDVD